MSSTNEDDFDLEALGLGVTTVQQPLHVPLFSMPQVDEGEESWRFLVDDACTSSILALPQVKENIHFCRSLVRNNHVRDAHWNFKLRETQLTAKLHLRVHDPNAMSQAERTQAHTDAQTLLSHCFNANEALCSIKSLVVIEDHNKGVHLLMILKAPVTRGDARRQYMGEKRRGENYENLPGILSLIKPIYLVIGSTHWQKASYIECRVKDILRNSGWSSSSYVKRVIQFVSPHPSPPFSSFLRGIISFS